MARVLIVGGGCRGLDLAHALCAQGHAVRVTTRKAERRTSIERAGVQCWVGDPDRIATLRYALENVTVVCWMLATASGTPDAVAALHGSRLRFMLGQVIDTTVRGFLYEAAGSVAPAQLADGAAMVATIAARNAIPHRVLDVDPARRGPWLTAARAGVDELLAPSGPALLESAGGRAPARSLVDRF